MSVRLHAERSMSLEWRARSRSLAWSNPLAWWWSLLTLVSAINIAAWFSLYHYLQKPPTGALGSTSHTELMLLLCAACLWLRVQIVLSARGCSAHLPVRHLAVERHDRTLGSDRGRGLLRGAVGDCPPSAGHHVGSGHHLERRVGDRAVDPDRGMLLMACGADQEVLCQRNRKFDMGVGFLHRRGWPLPLAAGV